MVEEKYYIMCSGWLCVVVLGFNDGIFFMVSIVIGVVVVSIICEFIIFVILVGLIVGVFFMVVGEYVFVSL